MHNADTTDGRRSKHSGASREDVVVNYYPQINFLARRMAMRLPSNVMVEDLVSAGALGLMDAMEKFDPEKGVKFGTYAEFRIKGAMIDELRSMDWLPRSIRKKSTMLHNARNKASVQLGRDVTDEEVAVELGIGEDEYRKMQDEVGSAMVISIEDLGLAREGDFSVWDSLADPSGVDPVETLGITQAREAIASAIRDLPEKERVVVSLYYVEELNMREIGAVMGITESRVSQLHSSAVTRLKSRLRRFCED